MERLINRLARKSVSVAFVGVLAFVSSGAMGLLLGIRPPHSGHDEFSYLLAADTFSHGRLTNPTHPMWVHFETMHVIHQPSYMSKYMPAQGLLLALGKIMGHPILGAWAGMAFMCAAICWMLHAWLPPRWALLGGLLAIIHPNIGIGNYWAQSYWGGAVPATGGALLLGGARYLMNKPCLNHSIITGLGLAILANSRPYEGLVLSLPVGLGLLTWLLRKKQPSVRVTVRQIILPLVIIGVFTVAGMAYYNYRITGNITRIPYVVHEQTYSMSSLFLWQELPQKPVYRHKIIEDFHAQFELPYYLQKHSFTGFVRITGLELLEYLVLVGNVFAIALIGSAKPILSWAWNDYWGRFALLIYSVFLLGLVLETYELPHYWAPITALEYFFILKSMQLWRARDRRIGTLVVVGLPFLALTILVLTTYLLLIERDDFTPSLQRAKLQAELDKDGDRHLILVKYGPHHSYFNEWVYNEADIDGSKVVWARAMNPKDDCELAQYFKGRKIQSLEIDNDEAPIRLNPFPNQSCQWAKNGASTSKPASFQ